MEIQRRLLKFVTRANWILFAVASLTGLLFASREFALGIIFGGLIVTVNFHLLYRTLRKSLRPPHVASHRTILAKYYLRFIVSALIIFVLIAHRIVHPLGLIAGVSIVVLSIMLATVREVKKLPASENADFLRSGGSFSRFAYYAGTGLIVVVLIFLGLVAGICLDRYVFYSTPWFTLIGLVLGILAGFASIGRAIRKIRRF